MKLKLNLQTQSNDVVRTAVLCLKRTKDINRTKTHQTTVQAHYCLPPARHGAALSTVKDSSLWRSVENCP